MTENPSPHPPPIGVNSNLRASRPNHYQFVGLVLLFTPLVLGLMLWIMVAVVVGEAVLEGPDKIPLLGPALIFAPNIFGGILLIFSKPLNARLPLTRRRSGTVMLIAGVLVFALMLYSLANTNVGDANIGAGLLLFFGAGLLTGGFLIRR